MRRVRKRGKNTAKKQREDDAASGFMLRLFWLCGLTLLFLLAQRPAPPFPLPLNWWHENGPRLMTSGWRPIECPALHMVSEEEENNGKAGPHRRQGTAALSAPLFIEPYVRPEFAARLAELRPTILAAAARHNRPHLSGMSQTEFAQVIALVLYNEHNGWLEDDIELLRVLTPAYQEMQIVANRRGLGSNFSVWPSNLRPSVALEIVQQRVPLAEPTLSLTVPLRVEGSAIVPENYHSRAELFAALTEELVQDKLAIEYLAANLERGVYRASFEGVDVSWQVLASWHNQGIVRPDQIRANPYTREYVCRASAYRDAARHLVEQNPERR